MQNQNVPYYLSHGKNRTRCLYAVLKLLPGKTVVLMQVHF